MIKKKAIFFIVCAFLVLIAGCETIKGACKGIAEGAKRDWENLENADDWMQENLW